MIPVDTPKPDDNRIKSGKYITKKDVYKHILEHGSEKLELGLIIR